ncbi:hypothetical protein [Flaviaesturariibacter amylovorans]|uniref:Uncharacterized protein n=1 Tax=Flaviaesturariibacter amylovorans TaxID=1084520 RepID=A0ABP8GN10_9BACT
MIVFTALCLLHLAPAPKQDSLPLLLDQKWYHSFSIEDGRKRSTTRKPLHERPWIYFGKEGFFEDFRGPREHYRGSWKWDGAARTVTLNWDIGKKPLRMVMNVQQLTRDTLLLVSNDPFASGNGYLSGRTN